MTTLLMAGMAFAANPPVLGPQPAPPSSEVRLRRAPAFHVGWALVASGAVQMGTGVPFLVALRNQPEPQGGASLFGGGFLALTGVTPIFLGSGAIVTGTMLMVANHKKRPVAVLPTPTGFLVKGQF